MPSIFHPSVSFVRKRPFLRNRMENWRQRWGKSTYPLYLQNTFFNIFDFWIVFIFVNTMYMTRWEQTSKRHFFQSCESFATQLFFYKSMVGITIKGRRFCNFDFDQSYWKFNFTLWSMKRHLLQFYKTAHPKFGTLGHWLNIDIHVYGLSLTL